MTWEEISEKLVQLQLNCQYTFQGDFKNHLINRFENTVFMSSSAIFKTMYSIYHWICYKISQLSIDYIINCTRRGSFNFSLHYSHQSTNSASLLSNFSSQNWSKPPDLQTEQNFHLSFHNSWTVFSSGVWTGLEP